MLLWSVCLSSLGGVCRDLLPTCNFLSEMWEGSNSVYVLYVRVPWIGDQHFLLAFGEEWHLEVVGVCELPT